MATLAEYLAALVKELRRIGKKVDGIRGPGVKHTPDAITIAPPTASAPVTPFSPPSVIPLKLTAPESGGGQYMGTATTGSVSLASGSNTLSYPLAGTTSPTNTAGVLIINPQEVGTDHHGFAAWKGYPINGEGRIVGSTTEATARAIVEWLGPQIPDNYFVFVSTNSGSVGGSSTACSLTYNVYDYDNHSRQLGSALSPVMQRRTIGKVSAGSIGVVRPATGTTVTLLLVDEVPTAVSCP